MDICCIICQKEVSKRGFAPHFFMVHQGGIQTNTSKANASRRGVSPWNKGRETSTEQKTKLSLANKGQRRSKEVCEKISVASKGRPGAGGFRIGGGRGKKGRFGGIHCDSSWELAFLIFAESQGWKVERNKSHRTYIFNGQVRKYYPDFVVDGELVEIKGWQTEQWKAKFAANPDVKIIGPEEIRPMIEYAKSIYGNDITVAYGE